MPKPPGTLVIKWRELAEEGYLYAEIARMYPEYSVDQVRHYCLGHTGRNLPGPVQRVDRWYGSNVWFRGSNSPHAELTEAQARKVLDDWDEEADRWRHARGRVGPAPQRLAFDHLHAAARGDLVSPRAPEPGAEAQEEEAVPEAVYLQAVAASTATSLRPDSPRGSRGARISGSHPTP